MEQGSHPLKNLSTHQISCLFVLRNTVGISGSNVSVDSDYMQIHDSVITKFRKGLHAQGLPISYCYWLQVVEEQS
jgi:hypothetical protein